mmetsp:Transcript_1493/g.5094  ORF Transcript_1493/g.5094 Transcript_1493/m.5094 type:complete len:1031 (-) Transcript_1493:64-3156(-)
MTTPSNREKEDNPLLCKSDSNTAMETITDSSSIGVRSEEDVRVPTNVETSQSAQFTVQQPTERISRLSTSMEPLYQPQFNNLEDLQEVLVPVSKNDIVIEIPHSEDESETAAEEITEVSLAVVPRRRRFGTRRRMKSSPLSPGHDDDSSEADHNDESSSRDGGYDDDEEDDLTEYDAESDHPTEDDRGSQKSAKRVKEYVSQQLNPKFRLRKKLVSRHLKKKKFALPSQVMAAKKEVAQHRQNTRLQIALNMARRNKLLQLKSEMQDTLNGLDKKIQQFKEAKSKGMIVNEREYLQCVKKRKWIEKRLKGFRSADLARSGKESTSWVWRYLTGRSSLPARNPVSWKELAVEDKVQVKNLIIDLIWAFLSFGMPAYRLDYAITMTATFYGLDAEMSVTPSHFFVAFHDFLIDEDEPLNPPPSSHGGAADGVQGAMFSHPSTISLTSLEKEWQNLSNNIVDSDSLDGMGGQNRQQSDDENANDDNFFGQDPAREANLNSSDDDEPPPRLSQPPATDQYSSDQNCPVGQFRPHERFEDDVSSDSRQLRRRFQSSSMQNHRHMPSVQHYDSEEDESGYSATSELRSPVTETQEDTHSHSEQQQFKKPKRQKLIEDAKLTRRKTSPNSDDDTPVGDPRGREPLSRRPSVVYGGSSTMAPTIDINPNKSQSKRAKYHHAEMSFLMCNSTHFVKVKATAMDLQKTVHLQNLCALLYGGFITIKEARGRLKEILKLRHIFTYPPVHFTCNVLAALGFSIILGANWVEMLCVAVGTMVVTIMEILLLRVFTLFAKLFVPLASIAGGLVGVLMRWAFINVLPVSPFLVGLCSVINLLPGYSLVLGITEISEKKTEAGMLRLSETAMKMVQIGFGLVIGGSLEQVWLPPQDAPAIYSNPLWAQVIGLVVAILCWALSFRVPVRIFIMIYIVFSAILVFFATYLTGLVAGSMIANFVGGLCVGLTCQVYSILTGQPSIAVSAPVILQLVPGSSGVRAAHAFGTGDSVKALEHVLNGVAIALSITIGFTVGRLMIPTTTRIMV